MPRRMGSLNADYREIPEVRNDLARRGSVTVCTVSEPGNVVGLVEEICRLDVVETVDSQQLGYNISDMLNFDFARVDILLLCHSVKNRGFVITDVTGAIYDEFLSKARKRLGKSKVAVIINDLEQFDIEPSRLSARMKSFRSTQKTTFENASLVEITGQLRETPSDLSQEQLQRLRQFLFAAAGSQPSCWVKLCCWCYRGRKRGVGSYTRVNDQSVMYDAATSTHF